MRDARWLSLAALCAAACATAPRSEEHTSELQSQSNLVCRLLLEKIDPKTDADGTDIAGLRLPEVQVPLATYTGWALRAGAHANDCCDGSGQYIPFAKTKAQGLAI